MLFSFFRFLLQQIIGCALFYIHIRCQNHAHPPIHYRKTTHTLGFVATKSEITKIQAHPPFHCTEHICRLSRGIIDSYIQNLIRIAVHLRIWKPGCWFYIWNCILPNAAYGASAGCSLRYLYRVRLAESLPGAAHGISTGHAGGNLRVRLRFSPPDKSLK